MTHQETAVGRVELEDDGLALVRFHAGVHVDVEAMQAILTAQGALGAWRVLVDARPVGSMTRAAQELSANSGVPGTRAVAILIDGPVTVVLGNFFVRLSRPPYAVRLFKDEGEARAWLDSYR